MLRKRQPIQKPAQSAPVYRLHDVCGRLLLWPFEFPTFQPAIIKPESVVIPVQHFEFVALPITKNEQMGREWVDLELHLHLDRQAVYRLSQIRRTAGKKYLLHSSRIQHDANTCTISRSTWG